jgi:hypothetical protein
MTKNYLVNLVTLSVLRYDMGLKRLSVQNCGAGGQSGTAEAGTVYRWTCTATVWRSARISRMRASARHWSAALEPSSAAGTEPVCRWLLGDFFVL